MVRPYKCDTDTRLAFWCQLQIVITLLAGLMLREKIPFLGNLDYKHQMETNVMTILIIVSHASLLFYGLVSKYKSEESEHRVMESTVVVVIVIFIS